MADEVHASLRALLHDPDFPCVGAKSVMNQGSYRFELYADMASPESTAALGRDLYAFVEERQALVGEFASFIASFVEPKMRTPKEFERMLWEQLSLLHELDKPNYAWSAEASADPADPRFSFSFGGEAFFIVGLGPASRRWARRFPWPTLVFNDHNQFERLREEQRFDRLRDMIRERDVRLHGKANPMLDDHGSKSEARQYSGRQVGPDWRCPVHFDVKEGEHHE
jgi:FPC/CPF motif-containing protein YcgG